MNIIDLEVLKIAKNAKKVIVIIVVKSILAAYVSKSIVNNVEGYKFAIIVINIIVLIVLIMELVPNVINVISIGVVIVYLKKTSIKNCA